MTIKEILNWHLKHYPLLKAEDVYKLIYQSVFGPGHLLNQKKNEPLYPHLEKMRQTLATELTLVRPSPQIPETEPIDPGATIIRVNLAPIKGQTKKEKILFRALVKTCTTFQPNPKLLNRRLQLAQQWCQDHLPDQAQRLLLLRQQKKLLPRHSAIYRKTYRPAYRVILASLWRF